MPHFYSLSSARLWLSLALLCLSVTLVTAQTIRYVKPVATGSGDGSSWANASGNLQRTIDRSAPDDQVWVAAGVYKPTRIPPGLDPTNERNKTFFFSNGVKVFGGFDGTETAIDQRDLTGPSSTTLSGDLGKPMSITIHNGSTDYVNNEDNSYNVVTIRGSSKTVLDGFIVTLAGGGSSGGGLLNDGSSRFVSGNTGSRPTVRNCYITQNSTSEYGGGIAEIGGTQNSGATYINCIISNNVAGQKGGGLYCQAYSSVCSPTFIGCRFIANSAYEGGGVHVDAYDGVCNPLFTNTIFQENKAACNCGNAHGGGAMHLAGNEGSGIINVKLTNCLLVRNSVESLGYFPNDPKLHYGGAVYAENVRGGITLTNCTITDNWATKAGFMYVKPSENSKLSFTVSARNSIIWENRKDQYSSPFKATVQYSLVQKGDPFLAGKGNIGAESEGDIIVFGPSGGYQLYPTSPGVNAGDPNTNPKDLPATDLDGNPRFQGRIDIGAYERDVLPNRPPVALTHPDETATVGIPMLSGGQEAFFVDPEDKPLTLTAAGLPASLSLIRNSSGSYAISGTPKTAGVSSVTLVAKDPEGLSDTLTFQLVVDTAPVAFQLTAPVYNCQTGAFTFKTTGGDGSPIEYQAPGITGWSANPNQYVDQGLRTANDVQPFTLMARQKGMVVSYSWNLKTACGRARLAASEVTDGLSVKVLGNPIVGETAQVAISGADGQSLTLSLADAAGNVVSGERIEQATTETRTIRLGQSAGVYLLRASTPTRSWTVRIVKQ